jgi:toxin ParE1/3/4
MAKFEVVWLSEAVLEKDEIIDYIEDRNVLASLAISKHLQQQASQLSDFPFLGRKCRLPDSFELVVSRTPYILAYMVQGHPVQILHVFHERRDWPLKH